MARNGKGGAPKRRPTCTLLTLQVVDVDDDTLDVLVHFAHHISRPDALYIADALDRIARDVRLAVADTIKD